MYLLLLFTSFILLITICSFFISMEIQKNSIYYLVLVHKYNFIFDYIYQLFIMPMEIQKKFCCNSPL